MYNSYVSGNAETLSISSDDSIWDSDSDDEVQTSVNSVVQVTTRLYHEHEEHSYCSTAEKLSQPTIHSQQSYSVEGLPIKRPCSYSSSEDDDDFGSPPAKRRAYSPSKDQRFLRCIHHHSASNIFQNGASPSEGVKLSPFQQEDDEESSDSEDDDEGDIAIKVDLSSSKTATEPAAVCLSPPTEDQTNVVTPEKYKRAILKRYLSRNLDDESEGGGKRAKTNRDTLEKRSVNCDTKPGESNQRMGSKASGKRKREDGDEEKEILGKISTWKRLKLIQENSEPSTPSERQNSELEAAEALTTLFRNHQNNRNNHLPNLKMAAQEMELKRKTNVKFNG